MNNLECLMLRTVFTNPRLPKEILLCMNKCQRYAEKKIKKLQQQGLIEIKRNKVTRFPRTGYRTSVEITPDGIRYLMREDRECFWIKKVRKDEIEKSKVLPSAMNRTAAQRYVQRESEANAFVSLCPGAVAMGAALLFRIPEIRYSPSSSHTELAEYSHLKLIYDAMYGSDTERTGDSLDCTAADRGDIKSSSFRYVSKAGMIYMNSRSAKGAYRNNDIFPDFEDDIPECDEGTARKKRQSENARNYASKMAGVIDSAGRVMPLYCTDGNTFMLTYEQSRKDQLLIREWINNGNSFTALKRDELFQSNLDGVLLVQNAEQFSSVYCGRMAERRGKECFMPVHAGLETIYIVPKTYLGTGYLSWLMTGNTLAHTKKLCEKILELDGVSTAENLRGDNYRYFPLKFGDKYISPGTVINTAQMDCIKEMSREKSIAVLCYAWQAEYYRKVLGEMNAGTDGKGHGVEILEIDRIIERPY